MPAPASAPFVLGANVPWVNYGCDFGANAWQPRGGLSQQPIPERVHRAFAALRDRGVTVVRWFLFCDARAGIRFDGDVPSGLDPWVIADVDAALALARQFDLRVMFVLFDFHWCKPVQVVNGVALGGRRRVFKDADLRAALLDTVVAPLFRHCADDPTIEAWDIVNEPEWVTFGLGTWNPFNSLGRRHVRALIGEVAALARAERAQPLTVGLASARWLALVDDLDLDYLQVHWYDGVERHVPPRAVADLGASRPVLLGEFPTKGSAHSPEALIGLAAGAGYSGALLWSALANDAATDWPVAEAALAAWTGNTHGSGDVRSSDDLA